MAHFKWSTAISVRRLQAFIDEQTYRPKKIDRSFYREHPSPCFTASPTHNAYGMYMYIGREGKVGRLLKWIHVTELEIFNWQCLHTINNTDSREEY